MACRAGLSGRTVSTAAVSKHKTGTVTKQTTGALQFMVAFVGWPLSSGRTRDGLDGAGGLSLVM